MANWNPRANDIFLEALEIRPADARQDFLERACANEPALRAQVESLLKANVQAGTFLESPAAALGLLEGSSDGSQEAPGTHIGPYKLLEQIGEGGFGLVFMAEQQQPVRRRVAVKVLKPGMDTRQVIARFEAERQALALMEHPNIARVLDAGATSSGRPFFVMELVRGIPITDYCEKNRLIARARLELFVPVCQAVQHAHQKGIIHRDIKPSNVMVTLHDGVPVVKIIDFGIAKAMGQQLTDKTLFTGFAQMIGTPLYMSPEQAEMSGLDIDTRTDIYSLGVLLYELLTSTTPFDKERLQRSSYEEIRRIIREEEPLRPSARISTLAQVATAVSSLGQGDAKQLSRLVRGELDWIVMKALEKNRERRYETASAFAADVQRYLRDEPVQACPPSATYRVGKFARRHKAVLVFGGLVWLFLLSLGSGVGWVVRDRAARDREAAREHEMRQGAINRELARVLDEARPLVEQSKWAEALAEVKHAESLLAPAEQSEYRGRLIDLEKELAVAQELEEIYRGPSSGKQLVIPGTTKADANSLRSQVSAEEEFFWGREQEPRFVRAFGDLGIDIEKLEPTESAAHIAQTSVRQALVRALDEWATLRRRARGDKDSGWRKLVAVAQQADEDSWRNRFRAASLSRDRKALEKLADIVPTREVPPISLWLLASELMELGAKDRAMTVLRQAQHQYPEEYRISNLLGWFNRTEFHPPRYEESIRFYMIASALRPRFAPGHRALAEVLMASGAADEAAVEYSRVVELTPEDVGAWNTRGWANIQLRRYDQALADFTKAIEVDPNVVAPRTNRAYVYNELHQYEKAIDDCTKAIELDPKNAPPWNNRGFAYKHLRQYDKAIADLTRALELDPKLFYAWNNRGTTYKALGQWHKAIADFDKALDLNPKFAVSWNNRGGARNSLQQWDQALADLNKAVELDPKLAHAWCHRGITYNGLRQPDKALADLNKAIELDPSLTPAWTERGLTHINLGRHEDAIRDYTRALERDPGIVYAWNNRAIAYERLGQYEKALIDYTKAIELEPKLASAWSSRGRTYSWLHQYEKAFADLSRALQLQPNSAAIRANAAWFLSTCPEPRTRDVKRALELADSAVKAVPKEGNFWAILAAARYRTGDWKGSAAASREAEKLLVGIQGLHCLFGQALFFEAMALQRTRDEKPARQAYDKALVWLENNRKLLDKNPALEEELRRIQEEADHILGIGRP
jgi:tetratricopeptide (TPR) repeat protein/tRNA A-37 threonylcarbamoyl transferase component Bud32